ncbi:hypothetical protein C1J02_05820 [Sulfitobacter sp. SK011]|nr:hypothetical protein C1J02_05820 [Sulfitobacter sp. SK011]
MPIGDIKTQKVWINGSARLKLTVGLIKTQSEAVGLSEKNCREWPLGTRVDIGRVRQMFRDRLWRKTLAKRTFLGHGGAQRQICQR